MKKKVFTFKKESMLPIDLTGKVAIVTGATQGIGLGIAKLLAKAGCKIAGCGLSDQQSEKAQNFIKQIGQEGQEAFYKKVDIKKEADIKGFIDEVLKVFGKIDFLVSNAKDIQNSFHCR